MNHTKIIGDLQEALYDIEKLKDERPPFAEREEILGLRFKKGQKVKDKKTKQGGEVIYATRVSVAIPRSGGGRS
ncbi:hypothetical protein J7J18_03305 [bacterium]|nr:hypothetical protein [bacterium]